MRYEDFLLYDSFYSHLRQQGHSDFNLQSLISATKSDFIPHIHQLSWSKLTQSYGHHQCCKSRYSKDAVDTHLSQSHNISELLHHLTPSQPSFPTNPLSLFLLNSKTPLTLYVTGHENTTKCTTTPWEHFTRNRGAFELHSLIPQNKGNNVSQQL